MSTSYREAGVDTAAGDLAVELMKSAVQKTHGPEVLGGVGGFAGLFALGVVLALLVQRTRRLVPSFVTHASFNATALATVIHQRAGH